MLSNLWIMRHGLAESQFESDFTRALSLKGKKEALSVAQQLVDNENILPDKMLVSPFLRAQETADIVHNHLAMSEAYKNEDLLVHYADPKLLGDFLLSCEHANLLVVSHMPIVAELCQYLVPGCSIYGFQTAQMVKIEFALNGVAKVANIYLPKE
jgi:phosphohistidine phosphatase